MIEPSVSQTDSDAMSSEEREILRKIWAECQAILASLRRWGETHPGENWTR